MKANMNTNSNQTKLLRTLKVEKKSTESAKKASKTAKLQK